MIRLMPETITLKSFRSFGWPKVLPLNYTLLISTKCSSRCRTCNIWRQKHDELTTDEWAKILKSLGRSPYWLTISGGEPFLQPHLVDLSRLIFKICQPAILNIPTNCLLWQIIPKKTEAILKSADKTKLVINLSLDGVGKKHDKIRGIKGNFAAFKKTFQKLCKLKEKYPNLTVGIHSVISKFNVNEVNELFDYVFSLNPDQYITEPAEERVELDTVGLDITPNYQEYCQAIDSLKPKDAPGSAEWPIPERRKRQLIAKITGAFRLEYYNFVKRWLRGEKIKMKDYAGWASCQITSWGEVWPSCLHGLELGNLKDVDYNFSKVWFGKKAQKFRVEYKNRPESFPLANAFYSSALFDLRTMAKVAFNLLRKVPK